MKKKTVIFLLLLILIFGTLNAFAEDNAFIKSVKPGDYVLFNDSDKIYYLEPTSLTTTSLICYDEIEGSASVIDTVSDTNPGFYNSTKFYNGSIYYCKNSNLMRYDIKTKNVTNFGSIHTTSFIFDGNYMYYTISIGKSPNAKYILVSRNLSTNRLATICTVHAYLSLLGVIDNNLYFSGWNLSGTQSGFYRMNLKAKTLNLVLKYNDRLSLDYNQSVNTFYYDASSKTVYFADGAGMKKFSTSDFKVHLIHSISKKDYSTVTPVNYFILGIEKTSGKTYIICAEKQYFTYKSQEATSSAPKTLYGTDYYYAVSRAREDGNSYTYIQSQNTYILINQNGELLYFANSKLFKYTSINNVQVCLEGVIDSSLSLDRSKDIIIQSPTTLSNNNLFSINGKQQYLRLKMVKGKYYEDWKPGAFMGTLWEGYYNLELVDDAGNTITKTDLSKIYKEPLIFNSQFQIQFDDYNNDGDLDFTIGQYGSSNGNGYKLFTLRKDGKIEVLPIKGYSSLFISNITGFYSTRLTKVDKVTFKIEYYDNSKSKQLEDVFKWDEKEFTKIESNEISGN